MSLMSVKALQGREVGRRKGTFERDVDDGTSGGFVERSLPHRTSFRPDDDRGRLVIFSAIGGRRATLDEEACRVAHVVFVAGDVLRRAFRQPMRVASSGGTCSGKMGEAEGEDEECCGSVEEHLEGVRGAT